jgi:hypothetical protein
MKIGKPKASLRKKLRRVGFTRKGEIGAIGDVGSLP